MAMAVKPTISITELTFSAVAMLLAYLIMREAPRLVSSREFRRPMQRPKDEGDFSVEAVREWCLLRQSVSRTSDEGFSVCWIKLNDVFPRAAG